MVARRKNKNTKDTTVAEAVDNESATDVVEVSNDSPASKDVAAEETTTTSSTNAGKVNETLFTSKGAAMSFYIPPCSTKKKLTKLIEERGGVVAPSWNSSAITIIPASAVKDFDRLQKPVYSSTYIAACIADDEILSLSDFDIFDTPEGKTWVEQKERAKRQQKRSQKDKRKSFSSPRRLKYSDQDDEEIVRFIDSTDANEYPRSGQKLWKLAEIQQVTQHTWQSMRERFLSHIQYDIQKIRSRLAARRSNQKKTKSASFSSKKKTNSSSEEESEGNLDSDDQDLIASFDSQPAFQNTQEEDAGLLATIKQQLSAEKPKRSRKHTEDSDVEEVDGKGSSGEDAPKSTKSPWKSSRPVRNVAHRVDLGELFTQEAHAGTDDDEEEEEEDNEDDSMDVEQPVSHRSGRLKGGHTTSKPAVSPSTKRKRSEDRESSSSKLPAASPQAKKTKMVPLPALAKVFTELEKVCDDVTMVYLALFVTSADVIRARRYLEGDESIRVWTPSEDEAILSGAPILKGRSKEDIQSRREFLTE